MSNELEAMREVHEIRRQIYEETKHMTPKERAYIAHCEAEKALRTYGLGHMMATTSDVQPSQRLSQDQREELVS